jgi:hypothetical protein
MTPPIGYLISDNDERGYQLKRASFISQPPLRIMRAGVI